MKAVVARSFGPPESFALEDVDIAAPAAGELRVRIRAAAVNFVDMLVASGRYQRRPDLPFTTGGEFAGIVEAIGPGVRDVAIGQAVCGSALCGAHAQGIVVRQDAVTPLPPGMRFAEGAVFRVANGTAMAALVQGAAAAPGERMLVLGAGGGVGHAAVAIGKALGATVIAAASSGGKRALALAAGADTVIASDDPEWRARLSDALHGAALDIVVDPLGGPWTEPAFRALGWGGRHLVIGFAGGAIPSLATNLALVKGSRLVGVNFGQFVRRQPDALRANMATLRDWWMGGRLPAPPVRLFPLERFREAMDAASDRSGLGRVVLDMAPDREDSGAHSL